MAKKKYSKKTLNAAKDYGKLLGWKRLSPKRVKFFLDKVKELTGHINIQNIVKTSQTSKNYLESENIRYIEAAKRWSQIERPTWNRIEKEELQEFKNIFTSFAEENKMHVNSQNALNFANSFFQPNDVNDLDLEFNDERNYIVEAMPSFTDSDVVDDYLKRPTFIKANIIDVDGNVIYAGSDRKSFWDSFREKADAGRFPIYNSFIKYLDSSGNYELTIEITSYYP